MTAIFETKYDGTGADSAKAGIKDVANSLSSVDTASASTGTNYDKLFSKMERPLGRAAFSGLAADMLSSSSAMGTATGATGMLSEGLHAVGNAAIFAGGEFAMIAIGAVAVYEIYNKLHGSSKETVEDFEKSMNAIVKNKDSLFELSTETSKYLNLTKEEKESISNNSKELQTQIIAKAEKVRIDAQDILNSIEHKQKVMEEYEAVKNLSSEDVRRTSTIKEAISLGITESNITKNIAKSKDQEKEATLKLAAANSILNQMTKNETSKKEKSLGADDTKEADAIIQKSNALLMTQIQLTNTLAASKTNLASYEKAYISEMDPLIRKFDAFRIVELNNQVTAETEALNERKALAKQEEQVYKEKANNSNKYMSAITNCITSSGKNIVFEGRKFMAQELIDATNQASMYLQIQAFKYFGAGNYGMGVAALAAAAAVKIAGAVGAAALGASSSSSDDSSTASATSTTATTSDTSASITPVDTRSMGVNVYVEGHILGGAKALGNALIDILNDSTIKDGKTLVATQLVTSGSTPV